MRGSFTNMARLLHDRLGRYLDSLAEVASSPTAMVKTSACAGESEAFSALLTGLGHQNPAEPLFMLDAFLTYDDHLSAEDFAALLEDSGRPASPEKAVRALELFTSLGFAQKHFTEGGQALYEQNRPGRHDHIICSGCGRTVEFNRPDVDDLIEKITCDEEYCRLNHRLVIYGLCPECRRRRAEGIPLTDAAVGESVCVVGFTGSDDLKRRLGDLGLRRGSRFKVLGEQTGAMIVFMEGCRLAMGPELAAGVMVKSAGEGYCDLRRHNRIHMARQERRSGNSRRHRDPAVEVSSD